MKIGLVSDTHDRADRTAAAIRLMLAAGAELILHAGDVTRGDIVRLFAGTPAHFVPGNNDAWRARELALACEETGAGWHDPYARLTLAGRTVVVAHGDDPRLLDRLLAGRPDYLVHGHTHAAADTTEAGVRVINPGALTRCRVKTCAVLDLGTGRLESLAVPEPA